MTNYKINMIFQNDKKDINDIFIKIISDLICKKLNSDVSSSYVNLFQSERS